MSVKELLFVTNNANKLREVNQMLSNKYNVLKLSEVGFEGDIPETQLTIEGNAAQKAHYIHDKLSISCFADDTGLEIEALQGRPGVYSARYAGPDCSSAENMDKVLAELEGETNRKARFKTIISLILDGVEHQFEGVVEGEILTERQGVEGFGYDPIFQPAGYGVTFAEMDMDTKNSISHRGIATRKLRDFLMG